MFETSQAGFAADTPCQLSITLHAHAANVCIPEGFSMRAVA
jgi:hypothetical protein